MPDLEQRFQAAIVSGVSAARSIVVKYKQELKPVVMLINDDGELVPAMMLFPDPNARPWDSKESLREVFHRHGNPVAGVLVAEVKAGLLTPGGVTSQDIAIVYATFPAIGKSSLTAYNVTGRQWFKTDVQIDIEPYVYRWLDEVLQ